ncbi:MAG: hypothetical protein AB1705_07445 [Verrucomicrobiota bacterium]
MRIHHLSNPPRRHWLFIKQLIACICILVGTHTEAGPIEVVRKWAIGRQQEGDTPLGHMSVELDGMYFHDGGLLVRSICELTYQSIHKIDLDTMQSVTLASHIPLFGTRKPGEFGEARETYRFTGKCGFDSRAHGHTLPVVGDTLYLVGGTNQLKALNLAARNVKEIETGFGATDQVRLSASRGRIYLASPDRILEFDAAAERFKILASTRRRPALNELDRRDYLGSARMHAADNGQVFALLHNGALLDVFSFDPKRNQWQPEKPVSSGIRTSVGNTFLDYDPTFHRSEVRATTNVIKMFTLLHEQDEEMPKWPFPESFPVFRTTLRNHGIVNAGQSVYKTMTFDGTNLWILHSVTNQQPATSSGDADAILWYFDERWDLPFVFPLRFSPRLKGTFSSFIQEVVLFPTPKGLIVQHLKDIWLVPQDELARRMDEEIRRQPRGPRRQVALLKQFDADRDGRLNAAELAALRRDPGVMRAAAKATAKKFIQPYDTNRDGCLEKSELASALEQPRDPLLQSKLKDLPLGNAAILEQLRILYDKNSDGKFDLPEVEYLLADTTKLTPARVTNRIAPGLQKYDRNNDGKLDDKEREAIRKDMEKKAK